MPSVYDPDLEVGSKLERVLTLVGDEVSRAQDKFPSIASPHEGYAVIKEELDELWAEIKDNRGRSRTARIEAKQIAAMAVRYLLDLPEEPADA